MGLFKCSKCECIDNTALGHYWMSDEDNLFIYDENNIEFKGKPLCCECAPKKFHDGTLTDFGKWHNKFLKRHISELSEEELEDIYNL